MPSSQFQQQAQLFFYKGVGGKSIQIDITPDWQVSSVTAFHCKTYTYGLQSPYVPSAAVPISAARSNALPYISEIDLLVFKINCCGLRPTPAKKLRDATDARTLAEDLCSRGSINLTSAQKIAVLQGLDDVAQLSRRDKSWWVAKLAL